ncbi:hypothetical protein [Kitasatospora sp. NPDC091207]|uniref:hypothetical protein n=1 Tax=Kitasatospora sp. NPDC091207 TaxID=3364083 RepID=UPI00381D213F
MSGMEREYIRDRTLEGHESARKRGKTIGGAGVTDPDMLSMALHLRDQEMSLRDIAKRLVITTGAKKGRHPSPATVMRMLPSMTSKLRSRRARDLGRYFAPWVRDRRPGPARRTPPAPRPLTRVCGEEAVRCRLAVRTDG